jgi:hypothetical protein
MAAMGSIVGVGMPMVGVGVGSELPCLHPTNVKQVITRRIFVQKIRISVIIPFSNRLRGLRVNGE